MYIGAQKRNTVRQEPDWEVEGRYETQVGEILRGFMHQAWTKLSFEFRFLDGVHPCQCNTQEC